MKTVIVLRHAKSDWSDSALRDFDRGLNDRGYRAAATMGRWAALQKLNFDAVIASPAVRVIETLRRFREAYGDCPAPVYDLRLYLASAGTIRDVLSETQEGHDSLLLAGHNPGLEEFILTASDRESRPGLRHSVEIKFPTAALAVLEFDVGRWTDLAPDMEGRANLRAFVRPRDLDAALGPDRR